MCVYNMADVLKVFNGPFAHREGPGFQWGAFQGRIPYPRPGTVSVPTRSSQQISALAYLSVGELSAPHPPPHQCPGGAFTPDIQTTKQFPDEVVTFARNHPLMFNPVHPLGRRPLVVRTSAAYRYTAVAADQVAAADGSYQVLFLGTGESGCLA